MADYSRRIQPFDSVITGDCEADPVPALWDQDDDYITGAGLLEKLWMPVAVAVLAGWAGFSFLMFNLFGWWAAAAMIGVVAFGAAAAIALVKTGARADADISVMEFPSENRESEATKDDRRLSRAA